MVPFAYWAQNGAPFSISVLNEKITSSGVIGLPLFDTRALLETAGHPLG